MPAKPYHHRLHERIAEKMPRRRPGDPLPKNYMSLLAEAHQEIEAELRRERIALEFGLHRRKLD